MKRVIFAICSFLMLSAGSVLFAQSSESNTASSSEKTESSGDSSEAFKYIPPLEAEEVSDLDLGRTKVVFNSNVKGAKIFLNGNFQGVSKLTLSNLVDGMYLLYVSKDGYNHKEYFVLVEGGKSKTFYIELEKIEKKNSSASVEKSENQEVSEASASEAAIGDVSSTPSEGNGAEQ